MANDALETLMGAAVIAVAAGFFVYASKSTGNIGAGEQYSLSASFRDGSGLTSGADVRISGVKVGTVHEMRLDQEDFTARAHLMIDEAIMLPEDSSARVASEGLLGGSYVAITPGGSPDMLQAGGEIEYTQGSVNLLDILGKAIHGAGGS